MSAEAVEGEKEVRRRDEVEDRVPWAGKES